MRIKVVFALNIPNANMKGDVDNSRYSIASNVIITRSLDLVQEYICEVFQVPKLIHEWEKLLSFSEEHNMIDHTGLQGSTLRLAP
jgi:hypothetical protein